MMKGSWLVYDLVRRWWRLLLVFSVVGALFGHLLDERPVFPMNYTATATVAFNAPQREFEDSSSTSRRFPPPVMVTLTSSTESSRRLAVADIESQMRRIVDFGATSLTSQGIIVDEIPLGVWQWWKAIVLGSVLGGLLALGCIYVWEDAKEYRRRAHQGV